MILRESWLLHAKIQTDRRNVGQPGSTAYPSSVLSCGRPIWIGTILVWWTSPLHHLNSPIGVILYWSSDGGQPLFDDGWVKCADIGFVRKLDIFLPTTKTIRVIINALWAWISDRDLCCSITLGYFSRTQLLTYGLAVQMTVALGRPWKPAHVFP